VQPRAQQQVQPRAQQCYNTVITLKNVHKNNNVVGEITDWMDQKRSNINYIVEEVNC
jgi:hypothetical protein